MWKTWVQSLSLHSPWSPTGPWTPGQPIRWPHRLYLLVWMYVHSMYVHSTLFTGKKMRLHKKRYPYGPFLLEEKEKRQQRFKKKLCMHRKKYWEIYIKTLTVMLPPGDLAIICWTSIIYVVKKIAKVLTKYFSVSSFSQPVSLPILSPSCHNPILWLP